jgi:excisionase family DNA binding protein
METKMLSTTTVAKRLNVHPTTIQAWVRQGHFPGAYKIGPGKTSSYVIPESAVDAYLETRQQAQKQTEEQTRRKDGSASQ